MHRDLVERPELPRKPAKSARDAPAVIQAVGARVESWFAPEAGAAGLVVIGLRDMDRAAIEAALNA